MNTNELLALASKCEARAKEWSQVANEVVHAQDKPIADCIERMLIDLAKDLVECSASIPCGATTELPNGESVSSCHRPKGHIGVHEGWCLGNRCVW